MFRKHVARGSLRLVNARAVALTEVVAAKRGFATAKLAHAIAARQFPRLAVQVAVTHRLPQKCLQKRRMELVPADVVPSSLACGSVQARHDRRRRHGDG